MVNFDYINNEINKNKQYLERVKRKVSEQEIQKGILENKLNSLLEEIKKEKAELTILLRESGLLEEDVELSTPLLEDLILKLSKELENANMELESLL